MKHVFIRGSAAAVEVGCNELACLSVAPTTYNLLEGSPNEDTPCRELDQCPGNRVRTRTPPLPSASDQVLSSVACLFTDLSITGLHFEVDLVELFQRRAQHRPGSSAVSAGSVLQGKLERTQHPNRKNPTTNRKNPTNTIRKNQLHPSPPLGFESEQGRRPPGSCCRAATSESPRFFRVHNSSCRCISKSTFSPCMKGSWVEVRRAFARAGKAERLGSAALAASAMTGHLCY